MNFIINHSDYGHNNFRAESLPVAVSETNQEIQSQERSTSKLHSTNQMNLKKQNLETA